MVPLDPIHSLLSRQLRQSSVEPATACPEWARLLVKVNEAYWAFDSDRAMLERSLELSSQELLQSSSEMRAVLLAFPDLFFRIDSTGRTLDCKGGAPVDFFRPPEQLIGRRLQDVPDLEVSSKLGHASDQVV